MGICECFKPKRVVEFEEFPQDAPVQTQQALQSQPAQVDSAKKMDKEKKGNKESKDIKKPEKEVKETVELEDKKKQSLGQGNINNRESVLGEEIETDRKLFEKWWCVDNNSYYYCWGMAWEGRKAWKVEDCYGSMNDYASYGNIELNLWFLFPITLVY